MARSCTTTVFTLTPTIILGEWSEQDHGQREEIGWVHGTISATEPPHDLSCFSFQWCYRPHRAPHSGPHQNRPLLVAQPAISQKPSYCYQGIFIFLGHRHAGGSLAAGDSGTPNARLRVGGAVPAVLGAGNPPGAKDTSKPMPWNKTLVSFPAPL